MINMKRLQAFSLITAVMLSLCGCGGSKSETSASASSEQPTQESVKPDAIATDSTAVANEEKTVVLDFFATWCGPCKAMAPAMEEMEKKYGDKIEFKKIDIDQYPDLAAQFQIRGVPTLVIVSPEGEIVNKQVGYQDASQLEEVFSKL